MRVRVEVMLKAGVQDPQGEAVASALRGLGFDGVGSVRQGKLFEIDMDAADRETAEAAARAMCEKLLANDVIETFAVKV